MIKGNVGDFSPKGKDDVRPYKPFAASEVELLALRLQGVVFDIKDAIDRCDREGGRKLYWAARAIGTVLEYLEGHDGSEVPA
jgi:hypothetical protein